MKPKKPDKHKDQTARKDQTTGKDLTTPKDLTTRKGLTRKDVPTPKDLTTPRDLTTPKQQTTMTDELASLVDALGDYALFLLSPEGNIRSWNRGAARVIGYTAEEVLGSHFSRFYAEEDIAANKPKREL